MTNSMGCSTTSRRRDPLQHANKLLRLSADARRQRCNLRHTLHRCGPGLRFYILSILPWAVIPKLTIMMSVRRARPPHHKFGADGVVPQRWSVSGLACQRICG